MSKYFPGQSGNPGGRPKSSAWVKHLASKHTEDAIKTLAALMNDPEQDGKTRAMAANALLDRAHGKPAQEVNANVNVSETSYEDVSTKVASILAGASIGDDTGGVGEPH